MKFTVGLTPEEVKKAIAEYIMNNFPSESVCEAADVTLEVEEVISGYGMGEITTMKFTGATAKVGEAE